MLFVDLGLYCVQCFFFFFSRFYSESFKYQITCRVTLSNQTKSSRAVSVCGWFLKKPTFSFSRKNFP